MLFGLGNVNPKVAIFTKAQLGVCFALSCYQIDFFFQYKNFKLTKTKILKMSQIYSCLVNKKKKILNQQN